jgi:hypothetical protein
VCYIIGIGTLKGDEGWEGKGISAWSLGISAAEVFLGLAWVLIILILMIIVFYSVHTTTLTFENTYIPLRI